MTPEELYRYDVTGYLLIEDAIAPAFLEKLQERMDYWEKEAHAILLQQDEGANPDIMIPGEGALTVPRKYRTAMLAIHFMTGFLIKPKKRAG